MSTEAELRDWRYGPIQAERLCAGILSIEGYTDVDPQATLGGPDGKKDILAVRGGNRWVGAVYFPPKPKTASEVAAKLVSDYEGVGRHDATGLAFFVNQYLTLTERDDLKKGVGGPVEIYHLERIRHILDTPLGYGLRLEYLRIEMTLEEQLGFFSGVQARLAGYLRQVAETPDSERALEALESAASDVGRTVVALAGDVLGRGSSISISASSLGDIVGAIAAPMADLSVATVLLLHRALTSDEVGAQAGQFRSVQVWISGEAPAAFAPPPPERVPGLVSELVEGWRETYPSLIGASTDEVVAALAQLHHAVVRVHPFLDGNGRLARALIDLAAQELLGRRVGSELTGETDAYYQSLVAADGGDLSALESLIKSSLA